MVEARDSSAAGSKPPPPPTERTIHEAELDSGASGAVLRGSELDMHGAVARRRAGQDVVICGPDTGENRRLAFEVEAGVGPVSKPQAPHERAGPMALPHFHQRHRSPDGHCFYETDKRKAKRKQ